MMVDYDPTKVKSRLGKIKREPKKLGSKIKNPLRNKKVENKKVESPNPMADDSVVPMSKKNKMMVDVLPIGEVKDQAKKIPGILKKGAKKLGRLLPLRPKEKVEEKKNGEVPNVVPNDEEKENDEVPNDEEIEMLVVDGPIDGAQSVAKKIA